MKRWHNEAVDSSRTAIHFQARWLVRLSGFGHILTHGGAFLYEVT